MGRSSRGVRPGIGLTPRTSLAWVKPLIQPLAQLEHDENGEVVLDLRIRLDLITRTEFCQVEMCP